MKKHLLAFAVAALAAGGAFAQANDTIAKVKASGVVTMVPDKRLDTYTARHRDYVAMAADYARSVEVLRGWADVDPARVGLRRGHLLLLRAEPRPTRTASGRPATWTGRGLQLFKLHP